MKSSHPSLPQAKSVHKSVQYQKIKEYRARIWAHPENYRCLCGNVGYKFKSGDIATPVCKRCDEIENSSHQLKDLHHNRNTNMKWDELPVRMEWRAGIPEWILDSLTQAETMLMRIESWIDDTPEVPICDDCGGSVMAHLDMCPITVHGHGTYVLQLEEKV